MYKREPTAGAPSSPLEGEEEKEQEKEEGEREEEQPTSQPTPLVGKGRDARKGHANLRPWHRHVHDG